MGGIAIDRPNQSMGCYHQGLDGCFHAPLSNMKETAEPSALQDQQELSKRLHPIPYVNENSVDTVTLQIESLLWSQDSILSQYICAL